MQVIINGAADEIPEESSVRDVLISRGLPDEFVIITLNDEMLAKDEWENRQLNARDKLEVIRIIGGG